MRIDNDKVKRNDTIRIIAVISMLLDHIGAFLVPEAQILRIVGRIAMPIFAFGLAVGIKKTSNTKKYALRLFIFAIVSQIPFYLLGEKKLNIIFTILFSLLLIKSLEMKGKYYLISFLMVLVLSFIPTDYGIYFALLVFVFYTFENNIIYGIILTFVITLYFSLIYYESPIQIFSLIGILLVYINKFGYIPNIKTNKYLFYVFYPTHLLIIYFIQFNMKCLHISLFCSRMLKVVT